MCLTPLIKFYLELICKINLLLWVTVNLNLKEEQNFTQMYSQCFVFWGVFFFSIFLNFIFKLYNIVLVLPNIEMKPPKVYMCSPSWTLLPPHTIPLGHPSAPAPRILYHASNLDWWLVSYMILYMFQCHFPKSPHPLPLPQSPQDCAIHQCLFCCLVHRVIVTF